CGGCCLASSAMRRLRPLAALLVVALATVALAAPRALGQQSDKQQELQQKVDEASSAETAARAQVANAQAEQQGLAGALADGHPRLAAANARLADAQATVDRLGFEALGLQLRADATQKKLDAARDDIRQSAVLLYRHGDGDAMLGLLGSTDGS